MVVVAVLLKAKSLFQNHYRSINRYVLDRSSNVLITAQLETVNHRVE
jgi:hypothetical protein